MCQPRTTEAQALASTPRIPMSGMIPRYRLSLQALAAEAANSRSSSLQRWALHVRIAAWRLTAPRQSKTLGHRCSRRQMHVAGAARCMLVSLVVLLGSAARAELASPDGPAIGSSPSGGQTSRLRTLGRQGARQLQEQLQVALAVQQWPSRALTHTRSCTQTVHTLLYGPVHRLEAQLVSLLCVADMYLHAHRRALVMADGSTPIPRNGLGAFTACHLTYHPKGRSPSSSQVLRVTR